MCVMPSWVGTGPGRELLLLSFLLLLAGAALVFIFRVVAAREALGLGLHL